MTLKLLFVLSLLAIFGALVYWRLRPYLLMARRMLGLVRDVQRMSMTESGKPQPHSEAGVKLTRCAACGTWIPATRALKLRASAAAYCSTDCMERPAQKPQRARQSTKS